MRYAPRRRPKTFSRTGFTLVEVALAIVIVGVGTTALMQLTAACTMQNRAANDMTTAVMLAQHVQEMLADLPICDPATGSATFGKEAGETLATFDDVDDFDGMTFATPLDSTRTPLAGFAGYSQRISVEPVYAKQLTANQGGTAIAKTVYTGAVRVRVEVLRTSPGSPAAPVCRLEWVRVEE